MKKYLMILLAGLLILLVGCSQDSKKTDTVGSPFIGGQKGVIAEFLQFGVFSEANNIEEIFQDETFSLEVDVTNKGEAEIEANNLKVKLSGIEPNSFTPVIPPEQSNTGKLEAVSEFNKQGGKETIIFVGQPFRYISPIAGNSVDLSFFAKIEYLYKTSVSVPKVCFKGDLNDKSLCTVDETKQVFSSAAPIQVKSAIERSAGSGIVSVELDVQNLGSGKVTTPSKDFDYRFDQLAFSVSPDKWDCKAGGKVGEARLDSTGKATISCRLKAEKKLQKSDLYEQELGLTLNYKYRDIINKPLRVKKQIQ